MNFDKSCKEFEPMLRGFYTKILAKLQSKACPLSDKVKKAVEQSWNNTTVCCGTPPRGGVGETEYDPNEDSAKMILKPGTSQGINILTLFHELVHAAGGNELDAEAFERHCFPQSYTQYDDNDKSEFFNDNLSGKLGPRRAGKFTLWNPKTGATWVNTGSTDTPRRGPGLRPLRPTRN